MRTLRVSNRITAPTPHKALYRHKGVGGVLGSQSQCAGAYTWHLCIGIIDHRRQHHHAFLVGQNSCAAGPHRSNQRVRRTEVNTNCPLYLVRKRGLSRLGDV